MEPLFLLLGIIVVAVLLVRPAPPAPMPEIIYVVAPPAGRSGGCLPLFIIAIVLLIVAALVGI